MFRLSALSLLLQSFQRWFLSLHGSAAFEHENFYCLLQGRKAMTVVVSSHLQNLIQYLVGIGPQQSDMSFLGIVFDGFCC